MDKTINWSAPFTRAYKQRIAQNQPLKHALFASLAAFRDNPALVSAHPLEGKMAGRWGFWINNDYRVIYRERENAILLLDIGTHDQVYAR